MAFNLLIETGDQSDFNYIVEEGTKDQPSRVYIEGPYMVAEKVNKNKRYYVKEEMAKEVERYTAEMIGNQRAMGELNHPSRPVRSCWATSGFRWKPNGTGHGPTSPHGWLD